MPTIIEQYLQDKANKENTDREKTARYFNEQPCSVCNKTEFVRKFRNVVGEISGSMQGYYSFFGGAFTGSIDGYTKTLPVLSCRNCENEREIKTYRRMREDDIFWDDMFYFYHGINGDDKNYIEKIPKIYLDNPKETKQYMLDNNNGSWSFYDRLPHFSIQSWLKAGFKIKQKVVTKKFLFFKWTKTIYDF